MKAHIIGGGTVSHVRSHLALTAPAYGQTARKLSWLCGPLRYDVEVHLTKMASEGTGNLETNEDIAELVDKLVQDKETKMIFFNPALVDYNAHVIGNWREKLSGKYNRRLESRKEAPTLQLEPTDKIIGSIRQKRKDIYLVGFKATAGATEDQQYLAGLKLLKESSANLVLANDVDTRTNMIITPEEARYHVTKNRDNALVNLVEMAYLRSGLTFTESRVKPGKTVTWDSELVSPTLREVVNYCIAHNAYKPFSGKTAGHFATKINDQEFLTSIRKSNFNELDKTGLVRVVSSGPDSVIAYGAKPSVGGQSQRIVFAQHPEYDSIVHFHCPPKPGVKVPTVQQRPYECGSHECGQNTSTGLQKIGNLSAVYLENHGPNIVFHHSINAQEVIDYIATNFDLSKKTGGFVEEVYA